MDHFDAAPAADELVELVFLIGELRLVPLLEYGALLWPFTEPGKHCLSQLLVERRPLLRNALALEVMLFEDSAGVFTSFPGQIDHFLLVVVFIRFEDILSEQADLAQLLTLQRAI